MTSNRAFRLFAIVVLTTGLASEALGQKSSRTSTTAPPSAANRMTVMLSGSVITEDGSPLPEPVSIERVCNGRVSRDGRSDFKGYFAITINISPGFQFGDPEGSAETGGGSGLNMGGPVWLRVQRGASATASALLGCELRASLAGFRSSNVHIPVDNLGSPVGTVNVGTIVLQRMGKEQGVTVSATSLKAPKDAKRAYEKGQQAIENNRLPEAQQDLAQAVQLYPQYAAAWQDLGWVYEQQNRLDKARNAFEQARTTDGMFVPPYVGLSSVALRESHWAEAAELSARATQLDSLSFPAAFYYNSLANYRLGDLEQAEKSARKAEMLGAQHTFPQVTLLMGVMLANRRDYVGAADQFRSYLKAAPNAPNAEKVRQQLAEVEKLGVARK